MDKKKYLEKSGTFYVGYVQCPKCQQNGQLTATVSKVCKKWYGPYYLVSHRKSKYLKIVAKSLKNEGMLGFEIAQSGKKTLQKYVSSCYLGGIPDNWNEKFEKNVSRIHQYMETEDESLKHVDNIYYKITRKIKKCPNCGRIMELIPCLTDLIYCSKKCQMEHKTKTSMRKNLAKKLLYNLYIEQQMSLRQTSHELHCSVRTICGILDIYGIPRRSGKIACKLRGAPSRDPKTGRFRLSQG